MPRTSKKQPSIRSWSGTRRWSRRRYGKPFRLTLAQEIGAQILAVVLFMTARAGKIELTVARVVKLLASFERVLNGWKNAGLPWSYNLDKGKMYKIDP
jgi:hypothetical protein